MRYLAAALVLAACASDPAPATDAGADTGPTADLGADAETPGDLGASDTGSTIDAPSVTDAGATGDASDAGDVDTGSDVVRVDGAPGDAARVYPPGPYGSREGALFEPFALPGCNLPEGSDGWRFDQDDFWTSRITVVMVSAMWCVPCQNEAMQLERELVQTYAGRGVRFVQILVQDQSRMTITSATCTTWVNRYGLTLPVLMDSQFVTQPFVPMAAFPGNVIVDRGGRIRWREYGSERGLVSIREAIDAALSTP